MGEQRAKLSRMRTLVRKNLLNTVQNIPQVTGFCRIDCTELLKVQKELEEKGKKISTTVFLAKAIAEGMKAYPQFNARLEGDEVITYDEINAGIGTNTPNGLIVVVLKNLQKLNLFEAADEFRALMHRVYDKKLTMDDISGGTFTISNMSKGDRHMFFTSLINNSEVFLIGISPICKEAIVMPDDSIQPRSCCYMMTNSNHIIADGVPISGFRETVCKYLENPRLFLEQEGLE